MSWCITNNNNTQYLLCIQDWSDGSDGEAAGAESRRRVSSVVRRRRKRQDTRGAVHTATTQPQQQSEITFHAQLFLIVTIVN